MKTLHHAAAATLAALTGLAIAGPEHASHAQRHLQEHLQPERRVEVRTEGVVELPGGGGTIELAPRLARLDQPAKSKSKMVIVTEDDDNRFEVTIVDGEITAKVNGEKLSSDRVKQHDGKLFLLTRDGQVMQEFAYQPGHGIGTGGGMVSGGAGGGAGGGVVSGFEWNTQPGLTVSRVSDRKVVLGITMSEPDQGLLEYLEFEPGTVVKIDRIFEGLPAARAGLKSNDIIVTIDGNKPVTSEVIGKVLDQKDPGDPVKLQIIRRGEKKEIVVKLDKYEPGVFGDAETEILSIPGYELLTTPNRPGFIKGPSVPTPPGAPRAFTHAPGVFTWQSDAGDEEFNVLIRKLAERAQQHDGKVELHEEEIQRLHEHAMKLAEQHARRMGDMQWQVEVQPQLQLREGETDLRLMIEPQIRQQAQQAEAEARIAVEQARQRADRASSNLDEIEHRLDRLDERLDRLEELLRRLADRD
ncbi:MAG: PDZ domain-containing protein [Phycisphaerales bacterium JB037]